MTAPLLKWSFVGLEGSTPEGIDQVAEPVLSHPLIAWTDDSKFFTITSVQTPLGSQQGLWMESLPDVLALPMGHFASVADAMAFAQKSVEETISSNELQPPFERSS